MSERKPTYEELAAQVRDLKREAEELRMLAADTADLNISDEASRLAMDKYQKNELELTALLECSAAALEYQEFREAAESILASCVKATRSRAGYIALYDENGEESLAARLGEIYQADESGKPQWLRELPELTCGAGGAVFINDIDEKDRAAGGHSCFLMSGILIKGKTVGAIALAGKPGGYTERNAKTITAFADLAAVSYRNALSVEALKNSEQFFRSVTETANDAIINADALGRITFWNKAAERIFGYTAEEMTGRTYFRLVPDSRRQKHEDMYRNGPAGDNIPTITHPLETRGRRRDGSIFPVELTLSRWEAGGLTHFTATVRDISDRKRTEDELVKARGQLEQRVEERTAELAALNAQLREEIARYGAARTALVESEARYSMLFDNTPDGILIVDAGTLGYRYANPAMCKMLGYTIEEILEKKVGDFAPVGASGDFVELFKQYSTKDSAFIPELAMLRKDGTLFFVDLHTTGAVVDGFRVGICFFRDVTERWQAQRAIRESEERYRTLAEAAQDFIFIVDYDGFLHYVNSYGAAQFHRRPQDIIGMRIQELFPAGTWEHQLANIQKVVHTGEPLYVENTAEIEGIERWLGSHLAPMRNQFEEVTTVLGISREITERKLAEQTLRESEERFRRIAENSPDMILRWTIGRGVEYISRAVETITGFTPEEVVDNMGFFAARIHHEDLPMFISALNGAALSPDGAKTTQIEYRLKHKNGSWVWVESRVIPTKEPDSGTIAFIEAITRDITERKRAEEDKSAMQRQLIQAQKMEAMGTLAGGMAHDFNNILSIIIGTSEIGLRKYSPEEPCYDRFKKILKASERAKDLTLKLLTFAKKEKLNIKTVTAGSIIEDVVDMIRRTLVVKVKIETRLAKHQCNISADVNQIHQALLNICINAVDAMPEGGALRIETEEVNGCPAKSAAGGVEDAPYCRIRISDTGIGMPPEVIERIFDPFFTTRNAGTGLGLSVTLGIINNHGGHIAVESEPGKGSAFDVFLPVAADGVSLCGVEADPHSEVFNSSGSVFIIDDNSEFMDVVKEALTMVGFGVMTSDNGAEALSVYEKSSGKIDIVLLDMIMAEMDGSELFHELRRLDPEARIIICSGHSVDGKASELLKNGALAFIQKPCSIAELFEKIVLALGNG